MSVLSKSALMVVSTQSVQFDSLPLDCGETLAPVDVAYQTYGELNAARSKEKELGTMEVLLASPLKPIQIVLGKVTPYLLLSFINALTIMLIGYFVFSVPIKGSFIFLMLESFLFILMALSLGILISTAAPNQMVAMFMSVFALMLPTILLSGFIFPIENMPTPLRIFSLIMPPRWFIVIIKNIMLKGTGIEYVWKETLILLTMTFVFIALSIKNFKIRLE
jgi:ABC-2 type transport system permease protein